jgi:hypothetical protein
MEFVCILWNDEDHSFTDVINRVSETTNMSTARARKIAETVDTQVSDDRIVDCPAPSHLTLLWLLTFLYGSVVTFRVGRL